jgi:hypothetical protein
MKKAILYISFILIAFVYAGTVVAQPHPNERPSAGTPLGGNRVGDGPSGAPVGNGTFILMGLALAYAGLKISPKQSGENEE